MPRRNKSAASDTPAFLGDLATKENGWRSAKPYSNEQIRILRFLAIARGPANARTIAFEADVDIAWIPPAIGKVDPVKRTKDEVKRGRPSLITRGFVREIIVPAKDEKGRPIRCYQITPEGRKALKQIETELEPDERGRYDY